MTTYVQNAELVARVSRELSTLADNTERLEAALSTIIHPVGQEGQPDTIMPIGDSLKRDLQGLDHMRQALGDLAKFLDQLAAHDLVLKAPPQDVLAKFSLKSIGGRILLDVPPNKDSEAENSGGDLQLF